MVCASCLKSDFSALSITIISDIMEPFDAILCANGHTGDLETAHATIQHYLALTDLRPGLDASVPYSSSSQVALHRALKALSTQSGYDTWTRIKDYLHTIHSTEGRRSSVLDVGTGTGVWAYELGDEEPYADVTGVE